MWIFINENLINIFDIDTVIISKVKSLDISTPYFIHICFKDTSHRLLIPQSSLEDAEKARELILLECNMLTSLLPRLQLTMEGNHRINTQIEAYNISHFSGDAN